jgi:hypothetical protein
VRWRELRTAIPLRKWTPAGVRKSRTRISIVEERAILCCPRHRLATFKLAEPRFSIPFCLPQRTLAYKSGSCCPAIRKQFTFYGLSATRRSARTALWETSRLCWVEHGLTGQPPR